MQDASERWFEMEKRGRNFFHILLLKVKSFNKSRI